MLLNIRYNRSTYNSLRILKSIQWSRVRLVVKLQLLKDFAKICKNYKYVAKYYVHGIIEIMSQLRKIRSFRKWILCISIWYND